MRAYKAIVWVTDPTVPGERVELAAAALDAAKALLRDDFGPDAPMSHWNEADANRVR